MRVYNLTSDEAAERILRNGFSDDHAAIHPGVWLSLPVYDVASLPAAKRTRLLAVDAPAGELAEYESGVLIDDADMLLDDERYREWVIPADVVNRWPIIDLGPPEPDAMG
jgi:hypothetical protein